MADIVFDSIEKTYKAGLFKKKVQAVKSLSLTIHEGEVFGLIGPNGAGKSTTIRMLLGLIRPDSGNVQYQGKALDSTVLKKNIGYLPENPYLYDHLTLAELLNFCGRTSGLNSVVTKERSQFLMDRLNLSEVQKRPLRNFSKGMLQRAGICFALLHNPSIVVFDEPMSGLDPIGRKMVFDLIMELKEQGKTIFFCSHILNDVERLCDRIGLLNKGSLIGEFGKEELSFSLGKKIFLYTQIFSDQQCVKISSLGVEVRSEGERMLLALDEERFYQVNAWLESEKIEVCGSRESWMTLEDMFMQKVMEVNQ